MITMENILFRKYAGMEIPFFLQNQGGELSGRGSRMEFIERNFWPM